MARTALTKDPFQAEPFGVMRRLADEMDWFFEGFGLPRTPMTRDGWMPAIESFSRNGQWVVRAELPGLTEKEVTVESSDGMLTIKGERQHESEATKDGRFRSERSYGRFLRVVSLPDGVNAAEAKASFKHGVLEIAMPQRALKTPDVKKIEITAG